MELWRLDSFAPFQSFPSSRLSGRGISVLLVIRRRTRAGADCWQAGTTPSRSAVTTYRHGPIFACRFVHASMPKVRKWSLGPPHAYGSYGHRRSEIAIDLGTSAREACDPTSVYRQDSSPSFVDCVSSRGLIKGFIIADQVLNLTPDFEYRDLCS